MNVLQEKLSENVCLHLPVWMFGTTMNTFVFGQHVTHTTFLLVHRGKVIPKYVRADSRLHWRQVYLCNQVIQLRCLHRPGLKEELMPLLGENYRKKWIKSWHSKRNNRRKTERKSDTIRETFGKCHRKAWQRRKKCVNEKKTPRCTVSDEPALMYSIRVPLYLALTLAELRYLRLFLNLSNSRVSALKKNGRE